MKNRTYPQINNINLEEFIPFYNTNSIKLAKSALDKMYLYAIKNDSALKTNLSTYFSHLLDINFTLQHTNIKKNSFDFNNLDPSRTINLTNNFDSKLISNFNKLSGVYCFLDKKTNELVYIGSAIDFKERLSNHYTDYKHFCKHKTNNKFYSHVEAAGGFSNFKLYFLEIINYNYLDLFKDNQDIMNLTSEFIIKAFIQFDCRIIEQALIMYFKPSTNLHTTVRFSYGNWSEENAQLYQIKNRSSIPIKAISKSGEVLEFKSIKSAALKLKLTNSHISRTCNCLEPYYLYSSVLDKEFHFIVEGYPIKEKVTTVVLEDITGIKLDSLPIDKIIVYHQNKVDIFGSFDKVTEARKALKLDENYQLWKYVNKENLIHSSELGIRVYLVRNPFNNIYSNQCKLENVSTGEVQYFVSEKSLSRYLKELGHIGSSNSNIRKWYLDKDKLFAGVYKISREAINNKDELDK